MEILFRMHSIGIQPIQYTHSSNRSPPHRPSPVDCSPTQKQRKLLLSRLRDCYNEAHDKYEVLYTDFTVSLQQDYQNEYGPNISKDEMVTFFLSISLFQIKRFFCLIKLLF